MFMAFPIADRGVGMFHSIPWSWLCVVLMVVLIVDRGDMFFPHAYSLSWAVGGKASYSHHHDSCGGDATAPLSFKLSCRCS